MLEQQKPIERQVINNPEEYQVWAFFSYKCERCGKEIRAQLARGVEGPRNDPNQAWVPSPFSVACDSCVGFMDHVNWQDDVRLDEFRKPQPGYIFIPDIEHGCGKLVKVAGSSQSLKVFSDDYYTVVARNKQEAIDFYMSQELGYDDEIKESVYEVDPGKKTMLFPVDELPAKYHDEEKYPRKDWCGEYIGVAITLAEAMQYRKEKPPYIICVSSDVV